MKEMTEQSEIRRLNRIYRKIPKNQYALVQGLIAEAARLRIRLNQLWTDIQENGETEMFSQSEKTEPYERERPAARLYTATNKCYQTIIKQLSDLCPDDDETDELANFLNE